MLARCTLGIATLLVSSGVTVSAADQPDGAVAAAPRAVGQMSHVAVQEFDKVKVQQFPWGWIRWLMNGQLDPGAEMTFGVVLIKPNQSNPLHLHPNCEECLHVLAGSCEHLVGDQWVALKKGDTIRIPKGVRHAARTRDESCRAVIVYNTGDRQFVALEQARE